MTHEEQAEIERNRGESIKRCSPVFSFGVMYTGAVPSLCEAGNGYGACMHKSM